MAKSHGSRETTLGECADWLSGGTPRKSRDDFWGGDIPWASAKDMKVFRLYDTEDHITELAIDDGARVAPEGAILILVRGMTLHNEVPLCVTMREMAFNQDVRAIVPKEGTDLNYLAYWLLAKKPMLLGLVDSAGHGTGRFHTDVLKALEISLPPLPEQRAIASILGALDDKIELNRRMNATLESLARAIFKSWFVDFDPVKINAGQMHASSAIPTAHDPRVLDLFPSTFQDSELGPIPEGWSVRTIDEVASLIIDYRGKTPKKLGSDWVESGIPALSAKNVKGGRLVRPDTMKYVDDELYEKWMKDELELNDILMTSEAPLGELFYLATNASYCLSQRVYAIRTNPDICESSYLYFWLESDECQDEMTSRATGTTVVGIRQSELRKVNVLVPPKAVQEKVADFLDDALLKLHTNELESENLSRLRDTLLPQLLSGKLPVPLEGA